AQHREELAVDDVEVQPTDGHDIAESLLDALEADGRWAAWRRRRWRAGRHVARRSVCCGRGRQSAPAGVVPGRESNADVTGVRRTSAGRDWRPLCGEAQGGVKRT